MFGSSFSIQTLYMQIQSEPLMASATNNNQEEEEEEGAAFVRGKEVQQENKKGLSFAAGQKKLCSCCRLQ